ncbi:MAG: hypothetical protein M0Q91_12080 [Methanoregula sp.]|jgi:hypothetical protein|nr:hypothetical protein [Methanoregula sp.]
MNQDAHLEDTRMPAEHDEDAEEPTIITGLKGNPDDEDYIIEVMRGGINWEAEEW